MLEIFWEHFCKFRWLDIKPTASTSSRKGNKHLPQHCKSDKKNILTKHQIENNQVSGAGDGRRKYDDPYNRGSWKARHCRLPNERPALKVCVGFILFQIKKQQFYQILMITCVGILKGAKAERGLDLIFKTEWRWQIKFWIDKRIEWKLE